MTTVLIQRFGDEYGVILPKSILDQLSVLEGDSLDVAQVPSGLVLTRNTPNISRQVDAALRGMDGYETALTELAK